MLQILLFLFSFIKLSNSYFIFTIEFSTGDFLHSVSPELKFKSNTELNVRAFIHSTSPISIQRTGSYEYNINYAGYQSSVLNIIINTHLISLNEMFMNAEQLKKIKLKSSGENIQFMESTFENCSYLISVDLTEFDLSNVISFRRTFYYFNW